jgi:hypothetical protein
VDNAFKKACMLQVYDNVLWGVQIEICV